ncbi:MAG: hypothetical protein K2J66_04650 [Muribaculaceae bacterium]|nr:hypothetical protein [Muribaculaceae bacterium]MDE6345748.1 hypothetical protein [Muribaculaceae bacterium]MDE6756415.1 hypothetical protein [Muribaculaceae bacterium]
MIDILIIGVIVFIFSLIFDKSGKKGWSKIADKFKLSSTSAFKVIGWGIVMLAAIALFGIICRKMVFG